MLRKNFHKRSQLSWNHRMAQVGKDLCRSPGTECRVLHLFLLNACAVFSPKTKYFLYLGH